MNAECPCGSEKHYSDCCQRLHLAAQQPSFCTPEQLMRSRFSAFVRSNLDYIIATSHPNYHAADERAQVAQALAAHQWHSLRVLAASPIKNNTATVEFVAFYTNTSDAQKATEPQQLHEQSNFIFEQNRWWYTDGKMLAAVKLQRNDACWCGSAKKYKKCHG